MPHYFFHTADGVMVRDNEGIDLADHATARVEAIRLAGAMIADDPGLLDDNADFCVIVSDGAGDRLFTLRMRASDDDHAPLAAG